MVLIPNGQPGSAVTLWNDPYSRGHDSGAAAPHALATVRLAQAAALTSGRSLPSAFPNVEKLPAVLSGVDEVRLNYATAVAEVTWRPVHTRLSSVARALDRLGYTPHLHRASRMHEARRAEGGDE